MSSTSTISLAGSGKAPREIKLWDKGRNETDYGSHHFTERSAAELMKAYGSRGNLIALDVEHGGAKDEEGNPREMAGYAKLEIRDGEPWLVFSWSDYGRDQIETGKRRYLSPEYLTTKDEPHEIVGLVRVSLVAEPGTHHARLLASRRVAASAKSTSPTRTDSMLPPEILAALKAACDSNDPNALRALLEKLTGDGGDTPVPPPGGVKASAEAEAKYRFSRRLPQAGKRIGPVILPNGTLRIEGSALDVAAAMRAGRTNIFGKVK
jgi:hypothetical protein